MTQQLPPDAGQAPAAPAASAPVSAPSSAALAQTAPKCTFSIPELLVPPSAASAACPGGCEGKRPATLHMDDLADIASCNSHAELLKTQLDAVDALYRIYKVEHYALLEEMRESCNSLKAEGKPVVVTSTSSPPAAIAASQPIRELVAGIRKSKKQKVEEPAAAPHAPEAATPRPAPAAAESPAADPTSPPPSATPAAATGAGAAAGGDALMHSPPGVSLNIWMSSQQGAGGAGQHAGAAGLTPQSLRDRGPGDNERGRFGERPGQQQGQSNGAVADKAPDEGRSENPSRGPAQPAGRSAASKAAAAAAKYEDSQLGYGSDEDPAEFTDVEELVLAGTREEAGASSSGPAAAADAAVSAAVARRERFGQSAAEVMGLEALASSCSEQDLDRQGALACLAGRAGRFLVQRVVVLLGRGSESKGQVDVDLALEQGACKVSRRQAYLTLNPEGRFLLENVGRRPLFVDGCELKQFETAAMRHLSMLEVGGVRLIFMVNQPAVERVLRRSVRLMT